MLAEVKHGVAAALWLAPLGVPLRVELRGIGDAAAVTLACRGWDGEPDSRAGSLELTLALDPAVSGAGTTEIEIAGRRLALAGAGVRGGASADRRHAWCALSSEWLEAPERLRSEVLEPLVLFLLARNGRTPLHAAVIGRDDLAILLMGPSGAGKSSLALAADAAGWTVLTEDTAYLQREPEPAIWGWPGPVHLIPADCPAATVASRVRNGRLKHAIPLQRQSAQAVKAARGTICVLVAGAAAALERLSPSEALRLMGPLEPGFDLLATDIRAACELLVRRGAWRLTLSADPAEAIALLSANLPGLSATAWGGGHHG